MNNDTNPDHFDGEKSITHPEDSKLDEKERVRLAKTILLLSILVYVFSAGLYIIGDQFLFSGPARVVWQFTSQAIFGIVNLIIGFYFGSK